MKVSVNADDRQRIEYLGGKKPKKMRHLFDPLAFGDVKKKDFFTTEKH